MPSVILLVEPVLDSMRTSVCPAGPALFCMTRLVMKNARPGTSLKHQLRFAMNVLKIASDAVVSFVFINISMYIQFRALDTRDFKQRERSRQ